MLHLKKLYFSIYDFILCKIWNIIILILKYLFSKLYIWSRQISKITKLFLSVEEYMNFRFFTKSMKYFIKY